MSIILAIETSVSSASIALSKDGELIASQEFESHRQQNQLLFPALQEILPESASDTPDLIIVGTGPGSYSGSRISIAAAQGLGIAYQCPVIGLCSYLATPSILANNTGYAVGDARRGSFFIAPLDSTSVAFSPDLMDEASFIEKTSKLESTLITFEESLPISNVKHELPHASGLIAAWQKLPDSEKEKLENTPPQPQYLRAPFITKAKPGHPLLRKKQ